MQKQFVQIVVAVVSIVVMVFLFRLIYDLTAGLRVSTVDPEVSLPILAVVGVLVVIVGLAFVAVIFSAFNLSDRTQALGLPEGSVRAVIALSLVILFAVLSVHLYGSLARGGSVVESASINRSTKDDLVKKLGAQVLYVETLAGSADPIATRDRASYRVHYWRGPRLDRTLSIA